MPHVTIDRKLTYEKLCENAVDYERDSMWLMAASFWRQAAEETSDMIKRIECRKLADACGEKARDAAVRTEMNREMNRDVNRVYVA